MVKEFQVDRKERKESTLSAGSKREIRLLDLPTAFTKTALAGLFTSE